MLVLQIPKTRMMINYKYVRVLSIYCSKSKAFYKIQEHLSRRQKRFVFINYYNYNIRSM